MAEAEKKEDLVLLRANDDIADQLTQKVEGLIPTTFSRQEAEGMISLINEALFGASAFYDHEMRDTLIGLSEAEFETIAAKLRRACD